MEYEKDELIVIDVCSSVFEWDNDLNTKHCQGLYTTSVSYAIAIRSEFRVKSNVSHKICTFRYDKAIQGFGTNLSKVALIFTNDRTPNVRLVINCV